MCDCTSLTFATYSLQKRIESENKPKKRSTGETAREQDSFTPLESRTASKGETRVRGDPRALRTLLEPS